MLAISFTLIGLVSSSHRLHNNSSKMKTSPGSEILCRFRLVGIEEQRRCLEMRNKYLEESNSEFEKEPPVRVMEEILNNPLIANVLEITCVSVPGGSYFVYENGKPFRFWISFEDSNGKPVELASMIGISSLALIRPMPKEPGKIEFGSLGFDLNALKGYLWGSRNVKNYRSSVFYRIPPPPHLEYRRWEPGEVVTLPTWLWQSRSIKDDIAPGIYRARVTCFFIREGEVDEQEIESEPITFEITEQHIKDYLATQDY
jgi:hypothetical protein